MTAIRSVLQNSNNFVVRDGLFYQKDFIPTDFEKNYVALRKSEGRLHDDHVVATLPHTGFKNETATEWLMRKKSASRIAAYFIRHERKKILEIGCGNGWFTNFISINTNAECCGVDINETELRQAVRVFGKNPRLTFVCMDISSASLPAGLFDTVIFASSIQYFSSANKMLRRLLDVLLPAGEVHIIDSPFYDSSEVSGARERSEMHFEESGHKEMVNHYYHHTLETFEGLSYAVEYDPKSFFNRISRKLLNDSPFPWIIVRR